MKKYQADIRYRDNNGELKTERVIINSNSLKDATRTAKNIATQSNKFYHSIYEIKEELVK